MSLPQKLTTPVAIMLLVSAGLACSLLRPKRPLTWHVTLEIDANAPGREAAVRQTVAVIERRLDLFGVSSFEVQAQGAPANGRILVSLPNVPDRERLKKIIAAGGRLEITPVISPASPAPVQTYQTRGEAEKAAAKENGLVTLCDSGSIAGRSFSILEKTPIVSGQDLRSASAFPVKGSSDVYSIAFTLRPEGADRLRTWTGAHVNSYLAIVLNDEVKSIAFVRSQISDQGEISGRFTKQSAEDLAQVLNSGALPAPVRIVDEGANKY